MTSKLQRYEAVVKLNTGHMVSYHNINTGLIKFHNFVCSKFNGEQIWEFYTVRRIATKEEIGTFVNATEDKQVKAIQIYAETKLNSTGTGVMLSFPFIREGYTIWRNLFIANSQILERKNDFIVVSEYLYQRMIKEAKIALFDYYIGKSHIISNVDEFEVGDDLKMEKVVVTKKGHRGTAPMVDYP